MRHIAISITNDIIYDRRMLRTANTLVSHGFIVTIIGRYSRQTKKDFPFTAYGLKCWFSNGIGFYMEYNIRLIWKLITLRPDTLLSVDSDTLIANTVVSYMFRTPLIIDMHELFTEVPELAHKPLKKWIWNQIEHLGIRRSQKRYTVSKTIADAYFKKYQMPFEVIRNVPVLEHPLPSQKKERFTLVYLGVLNKGRGLEALFKSIAGLRQIDLIIIGKGDMFSELNHLANELSITDQVQFLGWVSPKDIPSILQQGHVGINLLDPSSKSYYLSLANKYFDYIHAGLPMITMNFPEYQLLNQKHRTGILLNNLNVSDIQNAILHLVDEPELYKSLHINCITAKNTWNWNQESKRLLSIFDF